MTTDQLTAPAEAVAPVAAPTPAISPVVHLPEETLAAWVPNFEARFTDLQSWITMFDEVVEQAAKAGTGLFLLPEYLSECWMSFCPPERIKPTTDEWLAEQAAVVLAHMAELAQKHKMVIIAGTMILRDESGNWRNRCPVIFADGHTEYQDKISMMPDERDKAGLGSGTGLKMFEWKGYRFVVIVCLDIQIPRLATRLIDKGGPDLILVPSMTTYRSGYNRVFSCSAARSIEMHCPVLVTGGVGTITARGEVETNTSGAGLFLPCEAKFGFDGKQPGVGPFAHIEPKEGLLYIARNVPVAGCRNDRATGSCEAWHPANQLREQEVIA